MFWWYLHGPISLGFSDEPALEFRYLNNVPLKRYAEAALTVSTASKVLRSSSEIISQSLHKLYDLGMQLAANCLKPVFASPKN